MMANHFENKVNSYMTEIKRHIAGIREGVRFGVTDTKMLLAFSTKQGDVSIYLQFYKCTVRITVVYGKIVESEYEYQVRKRIKTFNSSTDGTYSYDIDEKSRQLTFSASHDMRKRNAADDADLPGFCDLICNTAVGQLDTLAELIMVLEKENGTKSIHPFVTERKQILEVV